MVVAPNSAVKNNLVAAWREFFVVEDGMLEVPLLPATLAATSFFTIDDHSLGEIATPEAPPPPPRQQVACPAVTPEAVLAASGHVQRFTGPTAAPPTFLLP